MSEIKPLLRQMIDNNKPYWRPETIRGAHKQLDEYEVKAKAWDLLTEDINFIESEIEEIGLSQMLAVKTIGIKALKRKNEYESGEYDAKK